MDSNAGLLISLMNLFSKAVIFLCTSAEGLLILASLFFLVCIAQAAKAVRAAEALNGAEHLGPGRFFVLVLESLGGTFARFVTWLPTLAILAVVSLSLVAVTGAVNRVEDIAKNEQRIRELRAVVRNLARSEKVADVLVLSLKDGVTTLRLEFFDPSLPQGSVEKRDIAIRGSDIYFDALVLNFDYSEIEAGTRRNIAIPYRVFSDEVAQRDGVSLGAVDGAGIPYAFRRSDADIYGLAPALYRARLAELMALASSDEASRREGIVRSLYGNAVHRRVKPGDRFEIRIEESGGMTVKEKPYF